MTKAEKTAFEKLKKYINDGNKVMALRWLNNIIEMWHTPSEFGLNPKQVQDCIESLLEIDDHFRKKLLEIIKK